MTNSLTHEKQLPPWQQKNQHRSTILVTGATGFLGKYVVEELLDNGYHVIAAGRNTQKLASFTDPRVETFAGNLTELSRQTMPVSGVVHAAALSTVWGPREEFYLHNVIGVQQMVDFCHRNGVKRLVHISSPSIYSQRGDRLNIQEWDYDPNNELTNYIWSKLRSEEVLAKVDQNRLETVILRPRGLIGAEDPSIVPRFLQANQKIGIPQVNGGRNQVDLTSVENVALACRLSLEADAVPGQTYNITNGEPRPLRELIDTMFELLNIEPRYREFNEATLYHLATTIEQTYRSLRIKAEPPLVRYSACTIAYAQTLDITKARTELGYEPVVPLNQGIENCAKVHRI